MVAGKDRYKLICVSYDKVFDKSYNLYGNREICDSATTYPLNISTYLKDIVSSITRNHAEKYQMLFNRPWNERAS